MVFERIIGLFFFRGGGRDIEMVNLHLVNSYIHMPQREGEREREGGREDIHTYIYIYIIYILYIIV